jgi:hypothetical protein
VARGGDVIVSAELCPAGTELTVVANTAQASTATAFSGSHPIGSTVQVKRLSEQEPAFIEIRDLPPAEVLVLIKLF